MQGLGINVRLFGRTAEPIDNKPLIESKSLWVKTHHAKAGSGF